MPLNPDQATFNQAVVTFMAAWETYVDTLSTGDQIILAPVCVGSGGTVTYNPRTMATAITGTDADPNGSPYKIYTKKGTATSWPIAVENPGGAHMYLFHKITNSSGDLT